MAEFIPSEEQKAIYDCIEHNFNNIFIEAYAGSGKSTTLKESLKHIPQGKTVQMICHNRLAAKNLRLMKDKLEKDGNQLPQTNINTYHSVGYLIILENLDKLGLTEKPNIVYDKYVQYINKNINELCNNQFLDIKRNKQAAYKNNLYFLINFCRINLNQTIDEIEGTISKYHIKPINNEAEAILKCLKWGKENIESIDYCDMLWLPYELMLDTKRHLADFVFVDEAQDTSPAQFEIFKKCFKKRGARFIAVGDENQLINGWCGSDIESYKKFSKWNRLTKTFTLSTSWRCGKKIIELAQKNVPQIKYNEKRGDGEVNYSVDITKIKPGDMVICRNNAPLIKLHMRLTKLGVKSFIQGNEMTNNSLFDFINSFNASSIEELAFLCQKFLIDKWYDTSSVTNKTMEDAACDEQVILAYDMVMSVLSMTSYCKTMEELMNAISNVMFDDEKNIDESDAVQLSTIHRAKGLERKNVFILYKSLIPSKLAKDDWEIEEEKNLEYVMITRAIDTLNFLKEEDDVNVQALINPKSMYNRLKEIRENIHYLDK